MTTREGIILYGGDWEKQRSCHPIAADRLPRWSKCSWCWRAGDRLGQLVVRPVKPGPWVTIIFHCHLRGATRLWREWRQSLIMALLTYGFGVFVIRTSTIRTFGREGISFYIVKINSSPTEHCTQCITYVQERVKASSKGKVILPSRSLGCDSSCDNLCTDTAHS